MATTAILSALEQEQQGLRAQLTGARQVQRAGREFWLGDLHGAPVVLALSRIGKVAAATTATTLIEAFGADRIVFTGVAGALGPDVRVGDVVVASHFVQHDMDASPLFPRFEVPLYRQAQFACDPGLTELLAQACRQTMAQWQQQHTNPPQVPPPAVHQGLIASGDRFIGTAQVSRDVQQGLRAHAMHALAVEMEGAAVAQVCHDYGTAFAAVRTISDRADDIAHVDFAQFVNDVAGVYAQRILVNFIARLVADPGGPSAPGRPGAG
ncbi:MAG: 5'-methylthioadenosine/adenosylhomocysteine nucleosidase [Rhodoferax sp.]|jgi:adenosylhomocysteine nucleosidase|nr:5'-methylthioadenosine/adenosylhomocysteine nucleosidase [Rhodoferax sp.]